ncbi:hypothetical protein [Caenimonas sedimenti]|uniref:hypothetical protein n=1 Tax=Caenimonas sedimenti TaxID=2596921 RepID=UPI002101E6A5|nr:hypothetical protein [Caenimonas sedimenti]
MGWILAGATVAALVSGGSGVEVQDASRAAAMTGAAWRKVVECFIMGPGEGYGSGAGA